MPVCKDCGNKEASQYFSLPDGYLCQPCFSKDITPKEEPKQHLPIFYRYICTVHKCGTYNVNVMARHEMPWCNVEKEATVGVVKPKTFGGYNGNITKHYFPDWTEHVRRNDNEIHAIKAWQKFTKRIPGKEKVHYQGNKYNRRVKNANRPRQILQIA